MNIIDAQRIIVHIFMPFSNASMQLTCFLSSVCSYNNSIRQTRLRDSDWHKVSQEALCLPGLSPAPVINQLGIDLFLFEVVVLLVAVLQQPQEPLQHISCMKEERGRGSASTNDKSQHQNKVLELSCRDLAQRKFMPPSLSCISFIGGLN